MKKNLIAFIIISNIINIKAQTKINSTTKTLNNKTQWINYVKPNIGTAHSRWFFYTPAALPFGMAKLGPSTNGHYGNASGWEAVGYDYRHTSIEGFAAFHEFQIGGIVTAATVGAIQTIPGKLENPDEGYRSRFDKSEEFATAGYYAVQLKDYNVKAELTATNRVAFQKYTFAKSKQSNLIFDIGNQQGESGKVKKAFVTRVDNNKIEGYVITEPEYVKVYQPGATVSMFFSAIISKSPKSWGTFKNNTVFANAQSIEGVGAGIYLVFDTEKNEKIEIKMGLSYTSIENARLNLATEAADLNFEEAKQLATQTWNDQLGRIAVESKDEKSKIKFYTGLYHALLGRGLASDVNGQYPKNNGGIGQITLNNKGVPIHKHYNTDSVWGAFWNLTQLWALGYPEYYSDFIKSQLLVYKETGWLGDGIANSRYVSGVGTNFVSLIIASAYSSGIRDFDINLAYEAALKNEITWENRPEGAGKMDLKPFVKTGYINFTKPFGKSDAEGSGFSASHTLEYAFSSYAVAQMAKQLGKKEDYKKLMKQSKSWENLYDPKTQLIRPKNNQSQFIDPFDPYAPWVGFQEGNAMQYTFYVPHDPERLIAKIGKETFNNRLDSIFTLSRKTVFGGGKEIDAFAGIKTLYNHGNQPNLHISWLFNFSGKPYLTQKWTRAICDEFYGTEGIHGYGYGQDEDQGQLGAWYVMAAIGLFDVGGLTKENPEFQIGSPLFDKVTINLNQDYYKGKQFSIETRNNSKNNFYLKNIQFNGKNQLNTAIPFSEITKGGVLLLDMSDKPIQ
ncbi:GH92 family glycosyl hydrolase [Flavobacterium sp. LB2P6]|uniref:GH92 family glycosyl hydrolase n=1 Tax=Flavobacterium sp. LB2P6 TaxID=3401714 RepID=UPI003AAB4693